MRYRQWGDCPMRSRAPTHAFRNDLFSPTLADRSAWPHSLTWLAARRSVTLTSVRSPIGEMRDRHCDRGCACTCHRSQQRQCHALGQTRGAKTTDPSGTDRARTASPLPLVRPPWMVENCRTADEAPPHLGRRVGPATVLESTMVAEACPIVDRSTEPNLPPFLTSALCVCRPKAGLPHSFPELPFPQHRIFLRAATSPVRARRCQESRERPLLPARPDTGSKELQTP